MPKLTNGDHGGNAASLATNGTLPVIIVDSLNADGSHGKKTGAAG